MLKIAVISDIHGNLPALKAVLEDINTFYSADKIYCLGDLIDGAPWHNEVIDLIRTLQIPTVMGNHDERIAMNRPVFALSKHSVYERTARLNSINYTKATVTKTNKRYLATLPASIRLQHAGVSCLLVHGSPTRNEQYIFENHGEGALRKMFKSAGVNIILSGHTHISYIRHIRGTEFADNKLFINVGSVGRPREQIGGKAVYLWLTIGKDMRQVNAQLRKIDYNIQETIEGIRESGVPDFYADYLQNQLNNNLL